MPLALKAPAGAVLVDEIFKHGFGFLFVETLFLKTGDDPVQKTSEYLLAAMPDVFGDGEVQQRPGDVVARRPAPCPGGRAQSPLPFPLPSQPLAPGLCHGRLPSLSPPVRLPRKRRLQM